MPTPKFNFIPEHQLGETNLGNGYWKITLLNKTKNKTLYFPKDMVSALEMDGKYFRFFADKEKKSIGWSEIKGKTELDHIQDARLFRKINYQGRVL